MAGMDFGREDRHELVHGLSYFAVNVGTCVALVVLCLWHWLSSSGEKAIQFVPGVIALRLIYSLVRFIGRCADSP
jgi:hypothetical protein